MSGRPIGLITGASRGVGAAVARALAPTHDLLLGGRDRVALDKVAAGLAGARPWPADLASSSDIAGKVRGIDRLDVLVHSAGVAPLGRIADTSAEVWRQTFEINVIAVAELTRLLLPALRAAGGHVILISSGSGQRPKAEWGAYSASKFALGAFADILRLEEAPNGLRVTTIYPGRTDTDMQRSTRVYEGGPYEPDKYLRPESVARAVLAAVTASPDAHITEITIRPAGGSPA